MKLFFDINEFAAIVGIKRRTLSRVLADEKIMPMIIRSNSRPRHRYTASQIEIVLQNKEKFLANRHSKPRRPSSARVL